MLERGRRRWSDPGLARVTTHINFYAHLWTDAVMRDLQVGILEIVRQRSERVTKR